MVQRKIGDISQKQRAAGVSGDNPPVSISTHRRRAARAPSRNTEEETAMEELFKYVWILIVVAILLLLLAEGAGG